MNIFTSIESSDLALMVLFILICACVFFVGIKDNQKEERKRNL